MSDSIYCADVTWLDGHRGRAALGNGPEMEFSAPPDSHGLPGVLTPEDAFVAAVNTCVMLMFLWAAERYHLKLLSYDCHAEGTKHIELDRTEIFSQVRLQPHIRLAAGDESPAVVEARAKKALQAAQKYSLVANSVKSQVIVQAQIRVECG